MNSNTLVLSVPAEVLERLDRISARTRRSRSEVFTFLVTSAADDSGDDGSGAPIQPFPEPMFRVEHAR